MPKLRSTRSWTPALVFAAIAILAAAGVAIAGNSAGGDDLLAQIRAEIIPTEGSETPYGIPLSLNSLPQFVDWWYTLVPSVENDPRYVQALSSLVAPCCDDNLAIKCCCENDEGQACNIIRSAKGLAAHLISDYDYDTHTLAASILQWLRYARPDYYLAIALEEAGENPRAYGLTTKGSCYRFMCNTAVSEGGCGGMKKLIEPAIESSES